MIPLHLSLSGFLSYRDRAELDFTGFELACIAGANGWQIRCWMRSLPRFGQTQGTIRDHRQSARGRQPDLAYGEYLRKHRRGERQLELRSSKISR
jgi:hypothetical protein